MRASALGGKAARALVWPAWILAALIAGPAVSVAITAAFGDLETWSHLAATVLPRYALTTFWLLLIVGTGVALIGTGAAWLVTACRFPGRGLFEVALALPLAFPAYVLAYAYTDLLDHPGIVQSTLRDVTGWGPRDYWFPEIRSMPGAAAMLILVLYPYVYLLARAAFLQGCPTAMNVARTLGSGPWSAFFRISLPMARPAIVAGIALAAMETIADFGTVAHFGVQTFATGIYSAWFSMGDRAAAAQLSTCLLMLALTLAGLERAQRGAAQRHQAGRRYEALGVARLTGWQAAAAVTLCGVPVIFGVLVPLAMLVSMGVDSGQSPFETRYLGFARNSLVLAGSAATITVLAALLIGYAERLAPGRVSRAAATMAGIGYAIPGGVIAVGLLVPLAAFDNGLDALARAHLGVSTGLLLTGTMAALLLAYSVRFMAVALNAVEAGLSTIRPAMDQAARTLGHGPAATLARVHAPLLRGSLLTAALIVFVDVMKELPATLIMRPFNMDTLAVQAYRLAADERLAQAAVPSLVIVGFGCLPVMLLAREIRRSRPGHAR
ncbi:ABC transporter permease [Paralimibaculum aggregatum]|nr:iron ABC transporter permease [Limibaculum sp. NKW23]